MGRPPLHEGQITDRDRKIFQFLFESKVASLTQILDRIFTGLSPQNSNRRMLKLTRGGWVRRGGHHQNGRLHYVYWLSEKAFRRFLHGNGSEAPREQLKSDCIEHDLALVNIRIRFEENPAVRSFLTENTLQSAGESDLPNEVRPWIGLRPDAAVEVIEQDHETMFVPLEYESSLKSIDRCRNKLRDYYVLHGGSAVFFICSDENVLRRMLKVDRELSAEYRPKMYFSLLSDVLQARDTLPFQKSDGTKHAFG
jgi:hypothetical protein